MNKLYIDPKREPELFANYGQQRMHRKAPDAYVNTQVLLDALRDPETIPTSTIGRVPNGLRDARGFIVTETTTYAAQHQSFDEDALDAWNRQRGEIERLANRRREIASAPLESAAPDQFVTTSQRTHVDLLPAVGMDTALATLFRDIQGRGKGSKECKIDNPAVAAGIAAPMGSWRSADGSLRAQSLKGAPEYALEYQEREAAIKDTDALRAQLQQERQCGVEFSRNGTTGRVDDFPIPVARKGPGFVIDVRGTSATYGDFDKSFYKNPDLFPETSTTPDEEEAIRQHHIRRAMRATGNFATTHSESFQDRSDEADTDAAHRRSHYFERKNATMQMPKRGNEPLLKSTNTQRGVEVAAVLPNAYTTTMMAMNQHFRKY